ncbi:MAG: FAD-binding oxidoreductase [Betaproteobacteria bacterium]|nr:FAD-binding oxidoreductase [Betaproteobacteria bacterium]
MLQELSAICGAAHVLSQGDLSAWEADWRKRKRGKALAVARPASTEEVAAVVQACARHGAPIVTQGGNTGLVVGSTPDDSGTEVVLSLQRMNRVLALDAANMTVTVQAGCVLQALQQAALERGLLFPLSLAAEGSCTIGGNLATNAGGTQVLRYGNARDLCLGLQVVNAQGQIWDGLQGLRKDNTGYDLRDLFIGSEGTLGVITAATLKLYPQPAAQMTAWAAVPTLEQAVALLGLAQSRLGPGLTGFEVMGQFALRLVARHFRHLRVPLHEHSAYCVLAELSDAESAEHARQSLEQLLELALEKNIIDDAVVAENQSQARQLWHIREAIPLAQVEEGLNIKHDISIPISRIPEFVSHTEALLARSISGVRLVNFGHLGDGNLHFNVQAPGGQDARHFLQTREAQVNALVYESVRAFGGSISAEHGIGALKVDELAHHKNPVALQMMQAIKQALDPLGLFNPGRVLFR